MNKEAAAGKAEAINPVEELDQETISNAIRYMNNMKRFAESVLETGYGEKAGENKKVYIDQKECSNAAIIALTLMLAEEPKDLDLEYSYFQCPHCNNVIGYLNEPYEHKNCLLCGKKIKWDIKD